MSDLEFELPESAIARYPAAERDASRLMVLDRKAGGIEHHRFTALPELLSPGDLVVVNDSRVLAARLFAARPTGGRTELLLIEPGETEHQWRVMATGAKKLRPDMRLVLLDPTGGETSHHATVQALEGEGFVRLLFSRPPTELAEHIGVLPLPPYLGRRAESIDEERYQTVFARAGQARSVAAPTAGLHFTESLIETLGRRGVEWAQVALDVGPGTFLPIRGAVHDHVMHTERYEVPEDAAERIARARAEGRRVIAVGTTVVRTLEASEGRAGPGQTDLFIRPGFSFQIVDALITNFHLPQSTLLYLVAAFAGSNLIMRAYREAIEAHYRFYSYGDAMFIQ